MILVIAFLILFTLWTAKLYFTREIIREADGTPYLIRYFIWRPRGKGHGRIYLHHIVRSDDVRVLHSHPWSFYSFILWGGYVEIAELKQIYMIGGNADDWTWSTDLPMGQLVREFSPLTLLHRPAEWRHRLLLPPGKTAWTLVKTSGRLREWGFHYPNGDYCPHQNYNTKTGLCED